MVVCVSASFAKDIMAVPLDMPQEPIPSSARNKWAAVERVKRNFLWQMPLSIWCAALLGANCGSQYHKMLQEQVLHCPA